MPRCRRTDAIVELITDPVTGIDALDAEQREHVAVCPDCHAAVEAVGELDRALARDLRGLRREELPTSILDTPAVPRASTRPAAPPMLLAAAAVVALMIVGVGWLSGRGIGIGDTSPTPAASSPVVAPSALPSAQPTPGPSVDESAAPAVSLTVGEMAAVITDDLVVRTAPGTTDDRTMLPDRLSTGQRVRVLDGPAEADEYTWWEIQVGEIVGWVADAEKDGSLPWLSPIANGRIAYSRGLSEEERPWAVYTVEPDGSDEQLLADPMDAAALRLVVSCAPAPGPVQWTHDGAWAAFDAPIPECAGTVYAVRADGSGLVALGSGRGPAWRPDGGVVVYSDVVNTFGDPNRSGPILAADPRGEAAPAPLVEVEPGTSAYGAAWSPDRHTIAFNAWSEELAASDALHPDIYLADADGTNLERLTEGASPIWSRDGRWILFTIYNPEAGTNDLYRIRPDGSNEERIGPGDQPAFSPDGLRLAVWRPLEGALWTMAPDGSEARDTGVTGVMGHAWSPDGTSLVVAGEHDGVVGLHVVTFDGDAASVTHLGIEGQTPTWQPVLLDPRLAAE